MFFSYSGPEVEENETGDNDDEEPRDQMPQNLNRKPLTPQQVSQITIYWF